MAVNTYAGLSQRTTAWAANEMLAHAEPILVLSKFGQTKPLPKNKADNVKFRRPIPYAVSVTPLTEGVTPTSQALTYEDVAVSIAQYGAVTEVTDVVMDVAEDPVLKDAAEMSGEQAAETVEMVLYGVIKAGTAVRYATSVANRASVVNALSLNDIRSAVRTIKAQRGRPINKILSGSTSYNTFPVEGGYVAFAHTDMEADIRGLAGFISVAEYGSRSPLCPEELGSVENVRFITSPLLASFPDAGGLAATNNIVTTTGTNADVYPVLVVSKDAYGCVPLKGESAISPTVVNATPSASDPLGQRGYVGWKTYFAGVILNQSWMVRIEAGASALV